jgi:RNA polymerase sigma-70 factor (ECF subfamily)
VAASSTQGRLGILAGDVDEDELTDTILFRRIRRGDRDAFGVLVHRYDQDLRRLASRLLAEPAQVDLLMTRAYAKAWRSRGLVRFGRRAAPGVARWLYRVVYNTCIDELRRQPVAPAPAPQDRPNLRLTQASVERRLAGLRALEPHERVPLVLIDGEGFGLEAASRILQRDPADVARDLRGARRRWRDLVAGEPDRVASSPETAPQGADDARDQAGEESHVR